MSEWWQDEQFWRDIGPYLFNSGVLETAASDVEELLDAIDVPEGARILDVGSGIGRLTFPLMERGFDVVGVETCNDFRRRARTRANQLGIELDIRPDGIIELTDAFSSEFDVALSVCAAIGYFADPVDDILAVKAMLSSLKPGGVLYVQTRHPNATSGHFKHTSALGTCNELRRFARETGIMTTTWSVSQGARSRVHRSNVRIYSKSDLEGLLDFCGFEQVITYEESARESIVTIGTKPLAD